MVLILNGRRNTGLNMVLIGIINNIFVEPTLLPITGQMLIVPNIITYEPHVVTGSIIAGYFIVEEIAYLLFWKEYVKPIREKIKCLIKNVMNYFLKEV
jgi:hypothetical protein